MKKILLVIIVVCMLMFTIPLQVFGLQLTVENKFNDSNPDSNNFNLENTPTVWLNKFLPRLNNDDASVIICFKDGLYVGTFNLREGCELWRTFDGLNWEQVVGENASIPNGFGNPLNSAIWSAEVFGETDNMYLYLGTMNWVEGCEVWRSSDGVNWNAVVGDNSNIPAGFGGEFRRFNYYAWIMEVAYVFLRAIPPVESKNYLCIGTFNPVCGGQIWRSPDGENWTMFDINSSATPNGFGDRDNYGIRTMETFNEKLYVGTATKLWSLSKGCEIWRQCSRTLNPPSWEKVNDDGFGDLGNKYAWSMKKFNGNLYVGTINLRGGCEIWRTSNGIKWTKVVGNGFDDKNNIGARIMTVFQNNLYVKQIGPHSFLYHQDKISLILLPFLIHFHSRSHKDVL